MSFYDYIAFPRGLNAFCLADIIGNEKKYGIDYDTKGFRKDILLFPGKNLEKFILTATKNLTFDNCFSHSYVYGIHIILSYNHSVEELSEQEKSSEYNEKIVQMINRGIKEMKEDRLALFNLIRKNTSKGEFVEIYSEFMDDGNTHLGPPNSEIELGLDELLDYKFTRDWNKKQKIIIENNIE